MSNNKEVFEEFVESPVAQLGDEFRVELENCVCHSFLKFNSYFFSGIFGLKYLVIKNNPNWTTYTISKPFKYFFSVRFESPVLLFDP